MRCARAAITALVCAAPVATLAQPIEISGLVDINPGPIFPQNSRAAPGVRLSIPSGKTTAWEVFADRGTNEVGTWGWYGFQHNRILRSPNGNLHVFRTIGLQGWYGDIRSTCCISEDHHGSVFSDTTTRSSTMSPPMLPFYGVGLAQRVGDRSWLRFEGTLGVYVARATVGLGVAFGHASR